MVKGNGKCAPISDSDLTLTKCESDGESDGELV
jgi:hypothetical protein